MPTSVLTANAFQREPCVFGTEGIIAVMVESEIKQLLNAVPTASMIRTPPGSVALLASGIEAAGGDLVEVREWIQAHGGREGRSEVERSHGLRPGQLVAPPPRVAHYFSIPVDALA
jgi:hypothetical protein